MEEVSLTETESRYFADLFLCCDVEKTGKIPMLKATELYRSANVPNDVILEIISLAGIPNSALHISRAQFYSCLKLIAAYQATMPLRQELISATVQLPLPRFSWKESPSCASTSAAAVGLSTAIHHQTNGLTSIPPPPITDRKNSLPRRMEWQELGATSSSRRNSAANQPQLEQQHQEAAMNSDVQSTDSEVEQNESSCGGDDVDLAIGLSSSSIRESRRRRGSPEAWSTNSDSPTPTNSVAERPWAKENLWHGLLGDEHRQLLGTEEESSDRHSSDDENETDLETIYQISPEQREYYHKQFKAVQHDPNGLLSGQVARVFFEKSRIPVEELRHIWQLCDVTRDGALSLAEFTAAMHLVVLRRNNIPLPAVLPPCLYPTVIQHATQLVAPQEPPEADLLHLNDDEDEDATDNTIVGAKISSMSTTAAATSTGTGAVPRIVGNEKNVMNLSTLSTSSQASVNSRHAISGSNNSANTITPPALPPPVKNRSISNSPNVAETNFTPPVMPSNAAISSVQKMKDRSLWGPTDVPPTQWTKFTESPTSNVSSPGPKPVNFDMQRTAQAVVSDPQILHPVPLRVTPVGGNLNVTASSTSADIHNESGSVSMLRESPKQLQTQPYTSTTTVGTVPSQYLHHRESLQSNDLRAIQRPQAKKLPAKNIGALPPPPQREPSINSTGGGGAGDGEQLNNSIAVMQSLPQQQQIATMYNKKDPPPLPPPRPGRHGRSSSLDLNKFKMSGAEGQPPEITAQASFDLQTSTGFADFTQFPEDNVASITEHYAETQQNQQIHSLPPQAMTTSLVVQQQTPVSLPPTRLSLQNNQRVSAFEVYRKPNTPRSSQSPPSMPDAAHSHQSHQQQHTHHHAQPTQPPPPAPVPAPFGSAGAAAIAALPVLPNADLFEKRVNAISETLRHVSFKSENNMSDVLRHLREQNNLLLSLCNDLSDELLTVQTRKEEIRMKLEALTHEMNTGNLTVGAPTQLMHLARTGSSISAPVTANVTGGSGSSGVHSNV